MLAGFTSAAGGTAAWLRLRNKVSEDFLGVTTFMSGLEASEVFEDPRLSRLSNGVPKP